MFGAEIIFASLGLAQGIIFSALWCIVYVRTKHRGAWLILPFFPLIGTLVVPIVVGGFLAVFGGGIALTVAITLGIFVFSVTPLAVFTVRLLRGHIRHESVADVFGD